MRAAIVLLALTVFAPAAPVPKQLKAKYPPDPERFVGTWDVVRTELNGQALATHAKLWTIDGGLRMKSHHDSGQVLNWTLKLDPAKSPSQIDVGSYKGIYEFDGEEVRIAYTLGGDRPTTFDAKPDVYLEVLRRAAADKDK